MREAVVLADVCEDGYDCETRWLQDPCNLICRLQEADLRQSNPLLGGGGRDLAHYHDGPRLVTNDTPSFASYEYRAIRAGVSGRRTLERNKAPHAK
jgi:hypothetical protein